jgi:hypothetical protein
VNDIADVDATATTTIGITLVGAQPEIIITANYDQDICLSSPK